MRADSGNKRANFYFIAGLIVAKQDTTSDVTVRYITAQETSGPVRFQKRGLYVGRVLRSLQGFILSTKFPKRFIVRFKFPVSDDATKRP